MDAYSNLTIVAWDDGFNITTPPAPPRARRMGFVTAKEYYIFLQASIVIRTVFCLTGICTNALNIRTFYRIGLKDSVTVVFFALAVCDFCHVCSALIYIIISVVGMLDREFQLGLVIPPVPIATLFVVAVRAFTEVTNLTTVFLALQRCACVALPLQFKNIFTVKRVVIVIVCLWLFCISLTALLLSQHELVKTFDPMLNGTRYIMVFKPNRELISGMVYTIFGIVLNTTNQLTILVCVFVLASALTKSVRFRQKSSTSGVENTKDVDQREEKGAQDANKKKEAATGSTKEKQAIIQVTLVSTIFLVCNTPRLTGAFVAMVEPRFDLYEEFHYLFSLLYVANTMFEIFNSSVNFFVYYKYNNKFKSVCFGNKLE